MRVAEGKLKRRALERGAVADADELKLLLEAILDAFDHVVDERTGETVEALGLAGVIRTRNDDLIAFAGNGHHRVEAAVQFALRALHRQVMTVDGHLNVGRNGDGLLANTRHIFAFLSYQM